MLTCKFPLTFPLTDDSETNFGAVNRDRQVSLQVYRDDDDDDDVPKPRPHLDVVLDYISSLESLVLRDADLLPDVLQVAQRFIQARHSLCCEHLASGTHKPGGGTVSSFVNKWFRWH